MRRCVATGSVRLIAGGVLGALLAITAVPLAAQPAAQTHPLPALGVGYDKAHEVTINATINQMVTKHVAGSPAGLHLLVTSPQGVVDAHLGPFMTPETRSALRTGRPIQLMGAMETIRGKKYLLARELSIGGRTVTVRNANGFLLRGQSARGHQRHRGASRIGGGGR
jgi:hypothetical protein